MCAAEFFRQRPNFSVDLAEIICQKLATLFFCPEPETNTNIAVVQDFVTPPPPSDIFSYQYLFPIRFYTWTYPNLTAVEGGIIPTTIFPPKVTVTPLMGYLQRCYS
jgi:hypothetical protein